MLLPSKPLKSLHYTMGLAQFRDWTVCRFCDILSTVVLYSLSNLCQYLTMYCLSVTCHSLHWCLVQSANCLSVPHTVPSVDSVSLSPLVSCTVCPLSVSTSHCTVCRFRVTLSNGILYSLSTVCQGLTLYRLSVPCHSLHWCLVQSVHWL